jgi:hypothetical protein
VGRDDIAIMHVEAADEPDIKPLYQTDFFRWISIVFSFNDISVMSWWSVLLAEETGIPGENHRLTVTDKLYHMMLYRLSGIRTHNSYARGSSRRTGHKTSLSNWFLQVNFHCVLNYLVKGGNWRVISCFKYNLSNKITFCKLFSHMLIFNCWIVSSNPAQSLTK